MRMMKKVTGFDVKDALALVGLELRRPIARALLPAAGLIALGAAIGAGLGLLFAPSSGRRLRQDVGERFDGVRSRIRKEARKRGLDAGRAIIP
jgi:hypothetical protein